MGIPAGFGFRAALLVAALSSVFAENTPVYFKLGGRLELRPAKGGPYTNVLWKLNDKLVAEWDDGLNPVTTYYRTFKGRTTLNVTSGELQITGMTEADSGTYTVQLNYTLQNDGYEAVAIKEVPMPKVEVSPPVCSDSSTKCTLICHGDVKGAGPVTFFWKVGEAEWEERGEELSIINDEESRRVETYACRMKNSVSQMDSKPRENPFSKAPASGHGPNVGAIVGSILVLIVVAVVVFGIVLYVCRDREPFKGWLTRLGLRKKDSNQNMGLPENGAQPNAEEERLNEPAGDDPANP